MFPLSREFTFLFSLALERLLFSLELCLERCRHSHDPVGCHTSTSASTALRGDINRAYPLNHDQRVSRTLDVNPCGKFCATWAPCGWIENIEKVLDRGDRIELLVDKTDTLRADAFRFKRTTREVRRQMWWRDVKMYLIVCVVAVFLVYFAVAQFCTFTLTKCVAFHHHGHHGGMPSGNSTGPNATTSAATSLTVI